MTILDNYMKLQELLAKLLTRTNEKFLDIEWSSFKYRSTGVGLFRMTAEEANDLWEANKSKYPFALRKLKVNTEASTIISNILGKSPSRKGANADLSIRLLCDRAALEAYDLDPRYYSKSACLLTTAKFEKLFTVLKTDIYNIDPFIVGLYWEAPWSSYKAAVDKLGLFSKDANDIEVYRSNLMAQLILQSKAKGEYTAKLQHWVDTYYSQYGLLVDS